MSLTFNDIKDNPIGSVFYHYAYNKKYCIVCKIDNNCWSYLSIALGCIAYLTDCNIQYKLITNHEHDDLIQRIREYHNLYLPKFKLLTLSITVNRRK